MGASGSAHTNAFQKERLGWLDYGVSPPLTAVTASGTYTLSPYEQPGIAPKALKILRSVDATTGQQSFYYLEYRQPSGFDGSPSSCLTLPPNFSRTSATLACARLGRAPFRAVSR